MVDITIFEVFYTLGLVSLLTGTKLCSKPSGFLIVYKKSRA